MNLAKEELDYFVEYVLLDEAFREPAKRQTKNLSGFWGGYGRTGRRRVSDLRERRYVCVEVLREIGGKSIAGAAAEVASKIYKLGSSDVEIMRTDYYEFKKANPHYSIARWIELFLHWRDWVLSSPEDTIGFVLAKYSEKFPKHYQKRMEKLMWDIRSDRDQGSRNKEWCEEQLAHHALTAAMHLDEVGRLCLKTGRPKEALKALEHALALWKSQGEGWPDRQTLVVSDLQEKVRRLRRGESVNAELQAEWLLPRISEEHSKERSAK